MIMLSQTKFKQQRPHDRFQQFRQHQTTSFCSQVIANKLAVVLSTFILRPPIIFSSELLLLPAPLPRQKIDGKIRLLGAAPAAAGRVYFTGLALLASCQDVKNELCWAAARWCHLPIELYVLMAHFWDMNNRENSFTIIDIID